MCTLARRLIGRTLRLHDALKFLPQLCSGSLRRGLCSSSLLVKLNGEVTALADFKFKLRQLDPGMPVERLRISPMVLMGANAPLRLSAY